MAATLSDVARRAGVSEATASRVLNGRRYVASQTRVRVKAAARDLDYVPHRAARDLSMARTATIALLVHHAQYPAHGEGTFTSRVVDGVSRALRRGGYDLLYVPVDDDTVDRMAGLAAVRPGRSDGVLVLGPAFPRRALDALVASGRPVVTLDNRIAATDAVLADNVPAMTQLTRHLTDVHGYRRLVCFAGPTTWPSTAERVRGVRAGARRSGASLHVVHADETTMRHGSELAARIATDAVDAVIAVNDALAIGALHRFRAGGDGRAPAVTGFDDIAWARMTEPPLTTVSVDADEIGKVAAELITTRIATPERDTLPAREVRVPAIVRLRRSCGCSTSSTPSAEVP